MKLSVTQILGSLIAAGIIANVTAFYSFNDRLARIETKLEYLRESKQIAKQP